MHDPVLVQIGDAVDDPLEPRFHLVLRHPVRIPLDHVLQALAGDVLHHDPGLLPIVVANVVERDQVGMLQVEALADPAEFDIQVAPNSLQRHLLCPHR